MMRSGARRRTSPRSCRNARSKGAPATEQTEVHVAYDNERLYFGIYAHYSDPALVRANRVDRDATENDDTVTFYIDPFLDQQRAYVVFGQRLRRSARCAAQPPARPGAAAAAATSRGTRCSHPPGSWSTMAGRRRWRSPSRACDTLPEETAKATGGGFRSSARFKTKNEVAHWAPISRDVLGFLRQMGSSTASRISRRPGTSSSCPRSPRSPSAT